MAKRAKGGPETWPSIRDHDGFRRAEEAMEKVRAQKRRVQAEMKQVSKRWNHTDPGDVDAAVAGLFDGGDVELKVEVSDKESLRREYRELETRMQGLNRMEAEVASRLRTEQKKAARWLGEQLSEEYGRMVKEAAPVVERLGALSAREEAIRQHLKQEDDFAVPAQVGTGKWKGGLGPSLMGLKTTWIEDWLKRAREDWAA